MNQAQTEAIANAEAHLNNAGLKLAIFVVTSFPKHKGVRRMEMHHVAGFNSEDAERRIKEHSLRYLIGDCYISTDAAVERVESVCKHYVTKFRDVPSISDADYLRWIAETTEAHTFDGQTQDPMVRRFEPFTAVYMAGTGWMYEDYLGRHGGFETEAEALEMARKHSIGQYELAW